MKIVLVIRLIIGMVLLSMIIIWIYDTYNSILDYHLYQNVELSLSMCAKYIYYSNRYASLIIITVAVIGFFKSNYIGWIALTSNFYFLWFFLMFVALPQAYIQNSPSILDYLLFLVPVLFIPLLNSSQFIVYYNLQTPNRFIANVNAMTLGLIFVSFRAYLILHFNLGYWEILDRIN